MFTAQIFKLVRTMITGTVNLSVAWWMLGNVKNIYEVESLHPDSPWTFPKFRVTFDASVIWGLIGPRRLFEPGGLYRNLVWLFLVVAVLPVPELWWYDLYFFYFLWCLLINNTEDMPVLHVALLSPRDKVRCNDGKNVVPDVWKVLDKINEFSERVGATEKALKDVVAVSIGGSLMLLEKDNEDKDLMIWITSLGNADPIDIVRAIAGLNPETILGWWQKYNYVLSAALDAGTAFMGILLFFTLQNEGHNLKWWGTKFDHCPLATCPTEINYTHKESNTHK
ncbi:hypothetical protein GIB67_021414 [Kingdonia uniflora]|uniref:Uncharacterized protein n=1 Tax=Kingdonia uniflora TaxID=39325 RepID=A0A7J7MDB4_9MAGN|nr:hypothetical protein GIB67_021414 [Kingdonia uniflora]